MRYIILFLTGWLYLSVMAGWAAVLGPSSPGQWDLFPLAQKGQVPLYLHFHYVPDRIESASLTYEPESMFQAWMGAAGMDYLTKWTTGPAGHPDHFSVQWRGYWNRGAMAVDLRLRADEQVVLEIDGKTVLQCAGCPQGVTTSLALDQCPHFLRLDYVENTGDAYVLLEYRLADGNWIPLVPDETEQQSGKHGWAASYYLDDHFEEVAFARLDPTVMFQWGPASPFNRDEDIPSATLEWSNQGDQVQGRFQPAESGKLFLQVQPLCPDSNNLGQKESSLTEFRVTSNQKDLINLCFNQNCEETQVPGSVKPQISFRLDAGEQLFFWEQPIETAQTRSLSGSLVGENLNESRKIYESQRPRLAGDLEGLDRILLSWGRWWISVLLADDQIRCQVDEEVELHLDPLQRDDEYQSGSRSKEDLFDQELSEALLEAASSYCRLVAPDLLRHSRLEQGTLVQGPMDSRLTLSGMTKESTRPDGKWSFPFLRQLSWAEKQTLQDHLSTWQRVYDRYRIPSDHASPMTAIPVFTKEEMQNPKLDVQLRQWLEALAYLYQILTDPLDSGVSVNGMIRKGTHSQLINWPIAGTVWPLVDMGERFTVTLGSGVSLAFNQVVNLSEIKIDSRNTIDARIRSSEETFVEIKPAGKISGIEWNGTPLLLVNRSGYLSGKLPSLEGNIKIHPFAHGGTGIPRE
jgi:hypothetical protein